MFLAGLPRAAARRLAFALGYSYFAPPGLSLCGLAPAKVTTALGQPEYSGSSNAFRSVQGKDIVITEDSEYFLPMQSRRKSGQAAVAALSFLLCAILVGCGPSKTYPKDAVFTERAQLAEFTTNFVTVRVALESDAQGKPLLRATFTPERADFHLYSKELPENGMGGIGRPTSFKMSSVEGVRAAGPLFADVEPHNLVESSGERLPVYPDGPVTLRLPLKLSPNRADSVPITFSYMACRTKGVCKNPTSKTITVVIPKS